LIQIKNDEVCFEDGLLGGAFCGFALGEGD
jgi:hypothetical protein